MRLRRAERPRAPSLRPALIFLELAAAEARALGHDYIGTEHLLLALLARRTGSATAVLERLGLVPDQIRERLLAELPEPAPPTLDREALATLGIDLDRVRARIEDAFGPGALEQTRAGCLSVAPRVKLALAYAVDEADSRPVSDSHVLIGLLCSQPSPAAQVLAELGVSLTMLRS